MSEANSTQPEETGSSPQQDQQRALLAFLLPFVVYMVFQTAEPTPIAATPVDQTEEAVEGEALEPEPKVWLGIPISPDKYPLVYSLKIVATLSVVLYFLPVYLQWPVRVSSLAIVVGVVGGFLWLGCSWLNPSGNLAEWLGPEHWLYDYIAPGDRPAYNPLSPEALGPTAYGFLFMGIRFFGLVLLVPVIEEAFLRAFWMRFVMHNNWATIPFGEVNRMAVAAGIALPVLYHPERFAALVWFSLVTWLMVRTKNYWDCVAAHAITNLILGIVVVSTGWWELW